MNKKEGLVKILSHINLISEILSNDNRVNNPEITNLDYEEFSGLAFEDYKEGEEGDDGVDGFSPIVKIEETSTGAIITITDKNGTTTATIKSGTNGANGTNGTNGVSPTITTSKTGKVTTLTIKDSTGTKNATINDGADGSNGTNGQDGEDGVGIQSIVQTTTSTSDGGTNVITVTLTNGQTATFNVKNGSKGSAGTNGTNGTNGTPGADGKSITAIAFVQTAEGVITGGTATLSDNTTIPITVTTETA